MFFDKLLCIQRKVLFFEPFQGYILEKCDTKILYINLFKHKNYGIRKEN